jgi:enterochelin esterase-like enzyme
MAIPGAARRSGQARNARAILRAMVWLRRRWGVWLTIATGIVAALTVAREHEATNLLQAKRESAEIAAHSVHRFAVPLEARDCAFGTLSPAPATRDLELLVREPGTERALRRFELKKSALEFGFCVEAPGNYVLELRAGEAGGGYELALEAVLARPPSPLAVRAGDPLMSPRVRALAAALPNPGLLAALSNELERDGTPLIEPVDAETSWVTFFYLGSPLTRRVSVDWQMLSPELEDTQLARLPGTNLWWKSVQLPSAMRLSYQLTIDPPSVPRSNQALFERAQAAVTLADPWNKAPMFPTLDPYVQRSTVQLPAAAPEPWLAPSSQPAPGKLEQHTLPSERLSHAHALTVYLPAGYEHAHAPLPLLIFFDGDSYLRDQEAKRILDAMIAGDALRELIAVFVLNDDPSQRTSELPCNPSFAAFVAEELLPFMRAHYRVTPDADQIGLAGSSFGGLASAFIALNYPERFGKVLSQSGSFWWTFDPDSPHYDRVDRAGWLRRRFAERPVSRTEFYLSAGLFEGSREGNGLLEENRALRDELRELGYSVAYQEFAGGHDHLAWRATLPDALIALYGTR